MKLVLTKTLLSVALYVYTQINKTRAENKRIPRMHFQLCFLHLCEREANQYINKGDADSLHITNQIEITTVFNVDEHTMANC